jgi:photosystem II stability/assembly factor-like uncharacterized protein
MELYLATQTGVLLATPSNGSWQTEKRGLDGRTVTSLIAREGVILAGTTDGIFRSDDCGLTWYEQSHGLTERHVRWLAFHPDISNCEFAGTEPAALFVSRDGGESWAERPEVAELRDQFGWWLPYSPEAGCVRGFAFHGQRLYAAVEVGGVLRSDDGGESWALAAGSDGDPSLSGPPEPLVYPDVHDIAVHPSDPDLVFAATGGGFYRSDDGGTTWALLYDCYCRALWLDPDDPAHIVFGPARYVGAGGRIEATRDGGQTWHLASDGVDVPWSRTMPERLRQIDDELFAVLDDGRLLVAPLATIQWKYILKDAGSVNALTAMQQ